MPSWIGLRLRKGVGRGTLLGFSVLSLACCLSILPLPLCGHPPVARATSIEAESLPPSLLERLAPYQHIREAELVGWLPGEDGLLIITHLGVFRQLYQVEIPGGMRHQLTFLEDSVGEASVASSAGRATAAFTKTRHEDELMLFDLRTGGTSVLARGQGKVGDPLFSRSGRLLAFVSTDTEGSEVQLRVLDPFTGKGPFAQLPGNGAWQPLDWSPGDAKLLLRHELSPVESELWLVEVPSLHRHLLQDSTGPVAYGPACFDASGDGVFFTSDQWRGVRELAYLRLDGGELRRLGDRFDWDIQELALSPKGEVLAFSVNENGASRLYLLRLGKKIRPHAVDLPSGVLSKLRFDPRRRKDPRLAFELTTAVMPRDVYVLEGILQRPRLVRWTSSETGGLAPERFIRPGLIRYRTFDQGLSGGTRVIPALYYLPPGPGPHPVVIVLHGGQGIQSRPDFDPRLQFWVKELGLAVLVPNFRGSTGYGRQYALLGGNAHLEEVTRDIDALLDWIEEKRELDSSRIGVFGEGGGGRIALATLAALGERLRAGAIVLRSWEDLGYLDQAEGISSALLAVEGLDDSAASEEKAKPVIKAFRRKDLDLSWAAHETGEAKSIRGWRWWEGQVAKFWLTRLFQRDTP